MKNKKMITTAKFFELRRPSIQFSPLRNHQQLKKKILNKQEGNYSSPSINCANSKYVQSSCQDSPVVYQENPIQKHQRNEKNTSETTKSYYFSSDCQLFTINII